MCKLWLACKGICAERLEVEDGEMGTWRCPKYALSPRDRLEVEVRDLD